MSKIVKFVQQTYNAKGIGGAVSAGAWKALIDGNIAETVLVHSPTGILRGVDDNGNKYYEDNGNQYGRHRWVVYKDPSKTDVTTIPAEWHAWVHSISDVCPTENPPKLPIYALPAFPSPTGTIDNYKPKGDWWNPKQRNWRKVQAWTPPQP